MYSVSLTGLNHVAVLVQCFSVTFHHVVLSYKKTEGQVDCRNLHYVVLDAWGLQ